MPTNEKYYKAWMGGGGCFAMPLAEWREEASALEDSYPTIDSLPFQVSYLYTSVMQHELDLFSRVHLHSGDEEEKIPAVLIGAVPDDQDVLFLFDLKAGTVINIDLQEPIPEVVNSSLRQFALFLYELSLYFSVDEGESHCAERAASLRRRLREIDPQAFTDPDSWWSIALGVLE
ncbi:SUKH-4 family immunity protein [Nocardia sp. CC227C]|uniref:SUKH-4 family immunity protein n=1 Tax=Nocardia sp. CC227C TaxID=3044562 RepID=UPI00278BC7B4|nr:SUKH-4 family immunity protein [Nocardia sp. CC227C]